MRKRILLFSAVLSGFSLTAGEIVANPQVKITDRYILPKVCGKYNWQTGLDSRNGLEITQQLGHDRVTALRAVELFGDKSKMHPVLKKRIELAEKGLLPVLGKNYPYFESKIAVPPKEQFEAMNKLPNFLGYRAFNEWGTGADRMIRAAFEGITVTTYAGKKMYAMAKPLLKDQKNPQTREEFEAICRFIWEKVNSPFGFETHVFDGSHYWAKAWPGGWNKIRAIITENRTPYRSNPILQSITRGAARMWQVPYGYFPAYDWLARISPPMYDHMQNPRAGYQDQQGLLKISPSLYERIFIYNMMGNPAIIADESDHSRYIDLAGSGQYRFSWYGEICEKMRKLNDDYDFGISYNPVALVLSWHNGLVYYGDKAFYRFAYNDGEQMTRELLHRVAYDFSEQHKISDELGATPCGDIFDVLRLDTPKGPVDPALLQNYPVVFLAGEQKFTEETVKVLTGYVRNGGTLILNTAMFQKGTFDPAFTGAEVAPAVSKGKLTVRADGKKFPSGTFRYRKLTPVNGAQVLYSAGKDPVVTRKTYGKGAVILCSQEFLLEEREFLVDNAKRKNILPVAHDLMKRIAKELFPVQFAGENLDKQLMYQVNVKGSGFVIALYNNGGMRYELADASSGLPVEIPDPCGTIKFTMRVPDNMKEAVDFIKHEKLYFKNDKNGKFLEFTIAPGKYTIVEISPEIIPDPVVTKPLNLALQKPVSASSFTPKFEAEKAVDGKENYKSAWWSKKACPQELTVDLGKAETVDSCRTVMAWSFNNEIYPRFSGYKVWYSNDLKDWKLAVDESRNVMFDTPAGVLRYFPEAVTARYFKLEVTFNSSRQGAQVIEFQLFAPGRTSQVTIPWKRDPSKASFPTAVLGMFRKKYLSDMQPVSATQSEAKLTMDKECYRQNNMKIRDREFARGLGTHAKSEIVYRLAPKEKWKLFTAYVGVDNAGGPRGTLEFKVYTDGKLAASSGQVNAGHDAVPIWADVSNCKELKLVVTDADDGIFGDIADWADAVLRK
ncbi:MAG: NPCBM/NEW2 domain-containing protein [Lentisphaeria bacterium]|nr:NPCBM/NEW2 domain-containing protein [Lentisphaeria bacterium]